MLSGRSQRLEEAVGNLEQAESNNRALLFSLEESRKTISRLTGDQAKLVLASSQLTQLTRSHSDLQQELSHEAKRATAAEAKLRKQADRNRDTEQRLAKAIEDLEEMRQDKVLRSKNSHDALTKVKAQLSASSRERLVTKGMDPLATLAEENPEAAELLKIVEGLVNENDALRIESKELQDALEASREEGAGLRSDLAHQNAFPDIHEHDREDDDLADISAASSGNISKMSHSTRSMRLSHASRRSVASIGANSLLAEVMASPSLDQDYDPIQPRPFSPASFGRHGSRTSISRPFGLPASSSAQSEELSRGSHQSAFASPAGAPLLPPRTSWDAEPDGVDELHQPGTTTPRRGSGNVGALGLITSGQKVPFGRGHVRRSMSVDVNSMGNNPHPRDRDRDRSPSRAPSLFSVASADEASGARTDRKHRPLSLSLGPSLFGRTGDEQRVASPTLGSSGQFERRPSYQARRSSQIVLMSASSEGPPVGWGSRPSRSRQSSVEPRPTVLVDSGTQTSPPPRSPPGFSPHPHTVSSTPRQLGNSTRSLSPPRMFSEATLSTSATTTSDLSADHCSAEFSLETRTAALSALIEHTSKLLGRVQAADVASQERRLRKQNLPGDVRHVAQANLQAVVGDIENLRAHFRRVLELERANAHAIAGHAGDSLVLRKDFVGLVKLLRDVLYELSRLRSLVNKVELDPSVASTMRELDELNLDQLSAARTETPHPSAGLLAPFSRLWSSTATAPSPSPGPEVDSTHLSPHTPRPSLATRAPLKREVSSAVSSATVNVEFGAGAARRAVATEGEAGAAAAAGVGGGHASGARLSPGAAGAARAKTVSMVKRDLSSIFVGGALPSRAVAEPYVMVPGGSQLAHHPAPIPAPAPAPRRMPSANPFGRLLAGFPTSFTTSLATNAVTDSFQHTPARPGAAADGPPPTLLERQLRPRGLSDSSIRSTFTAHGAGGVGAANPQHRVLTKASLVLSAETRGEGAVARPVGIAGVGGGAGGGGSEGLHARLTELSVSRKPSSSWLRPAMASSRSASPASPAPPSPLSSGPPSVTTAASPSASSSTPAPQPISISPPSISIAPSPAASYQDAGLGGASVTGGGLFTNLSQWAMGRRGEEVESLGEGGETPVAGRGGVKAVSVSSSLSSSMSGRAGKRT